MILEEIRLQDFRCFHGESVIKFSTDPKKNVTVIYAENGVGKTTLLNALLWCLFGETTARFEKKDEILNYDAAKSKRTLASVEVFFEHNDKHYVAKRFFDAGQRIVSPQGTFKVARIENGHLNFNFTNTYETFINTVIPRDMAGHFLFDGEHAENFSSEENKGKVKDAVRDILGCTLIETAVEDLKAASAQFRRKIASSSLSADIEQLGSEIEALTSQISDAEKLLEEVNNNRIATERQISDIDQKLRDTDHAKHYQRERDNISQQLEKARKRKQDCENDILKWLGDQGRFIVSKKITEEAFDFLEQEQSRGRIPAPYNEEFVKDLLSAKKCICGRELKVGSEEANNVACLLHQAANKIMIDRVVRIRARINNLKQQRKLAPGKLVEAKAKLAVENQEISNLEAKEAEVSEKIKNINFEDIAQRETKREGLKKQLSSIDQQIGAVRTNMEAAATAIKAKERQIETLANEDKQTRIFVKRRTLTERLIGLLETRLVSEEQQARKVLRASVKKILESASRKNFSVKLGEDYTISLLNKDNVTLPKSSGENQLLGLAFTAALVEFAKIRQTAQDQSLLPGTIAPLVLDSPFGQLDKMYRTATAEFMPKMSRQVILMLSQTQGDQDVMEVLAPYIDEEYVLIRHNSEDRGERKHETRALRGKQYIITEYNSGFDGTEIKRVA